MRRRRRVYHYNIVIENTSSVTYLVLNGVRMNLTGETAELINISIN